MSNPERLPAKRDPHAPRIGDSVVYKGRAGERLMDRFDQDRQWRTIRKGQGKTWYSLAELTDPALARRIAREGRSTT